MYQKISSKEKGKIVVKIGIIGVGTVGQSVIKILEKNSDIIKARSGKKIVVTKGVVRDLNKKRDILTPLSNNIDDILEDKEIDIVVELMGGVDKPYEVVKNALLKGKNVVTANKALLAYHRYNLQNIAKDLALGFEASVAGGIPIITALREGLSANHIEAIRGILNGTCNFILTKMMNEGANFTEVLKEAQELGYAEADPTFDVGGFDAAHKLLILASIAYGLDAKPEDILIEGIENITSEDIEFAKEFGYSIKLLAIAKKVKNSIELRVHPALIKKNEMIAKVDGVMNGISVIGDSVGETMYYGAGAGGDATASAVIADIIQIARDKNSPMLGFKEPLEGNTLILQNPKNIISKYYLRIAVVDEIGVLAKITQILSNYNISIASVLQRDNSQNITNLLFSTHKCKESNVQSALIKINTLECVKKKPILIRIEVK